MNAFLWRVAMWTLICVTLCAPMRADALVRMNVDEAEAALIILEKRAAGQTVTDEDWKRLFESEPYIRLRQREAAMKRDFTDDEFRTFLLASEMAARAGQLRSTLNEWKAINLASAAATAASYLPDGVAIRAKVYPVIKPKSNSFVFEITTDPAIFLYLDPSVTPEKLENTLAHEFHHIGYGSRCPTEPSRSAIESLPDDLAWIVRRLGAFGEGFAMLAAAGGPDVHPQEVSPDEQRREWDENVAHFEEDLGRIETFIAETLDGSLSFEERNRSFRSFYGEQGPWYTVGWKMAVTIEEELGRGVLLEAFCDVRTLLSVYNRAAESRQRRGFENLPTFSRNIVAILAGVAPDGGNENSIP